MVCSNGVHVETSTLLLAAISPWLRWLMEEAGEEFCLCLPAITGRQLEDFLNTCLAEKPGEEYYFNKHTNEFISQLLNPKEWGKNKRKEIQFSLKTPVVNLRALESALINQYYSRHEKLESYEELEDVKKEIDSDCDENETKDALLELEGFHAACNKSDKIQFEVNSEQKLDTSKVNNDKKFADNVRQISDKGEQQMRSPTDDTKVVQPEWDPSEDECEDNPHFPTRRRSRGDKVMVKLCPECGQEFKRKKHAASKNAFSGFEEHVMKHKVHNFICECADVPKLAAVDKLLVDCGDQRRKRDTYWQIERHMKLIHMGWVACSQCEQTFKSEILLSSHMKEHEQSICEECGYKALSRSNMYYHKYNFHGNGMNNVVCDVCSKTFKNITSLKVHIKNSHNEKECKLCGKVVKKLHQHIKIMHQADSEKRFPCPDCEKAFHDKTKLASHQMSVHIKSRPHSCR